MTWLEGSTHRCSPKGLVVALESQAHKATLPVHIDAEGIGRYPQETKAARYFCTLEALQNVQKYAAATSVDVRLHDESGQVHVDVIDDGRGFRCDRCQPRRRPDEHGRPARRPTPTSTSNRPGAGTRLRGNVPIPPRLERDRGRGAHTLGAETRIIGAGQAAVVPSDVEHSARASSDFRAIIVDFPPVQQWPVSVPDCSISQPGNGLAG